MWGTDRRTCVLQHLMYFGRAFWADDQQTRSIKLQADIRYRVATSKSRGGLATCLPAAQSQGEFKAPSASRRRAGMSFVFKPSHEFLGRRRLSLVEMGESMGLAALQEGKCMKTKRTRIFWETCLVQCVQQSDTHVYHLCDRWTKSSTHSKTQSKIPPSNLTAFQPPHPGSKKPLSTKLAK